MNYKEFSTEELIQNLRDFADLKIEPSYDLFREAADRLEELDERVAMSEGEQVTMEELVK